MYVHSVKLINYKSIGDYSESEIIIDPRITAIIGKNESGKSNVLDGMSRILFRRKNPNAFQTDLANRNDTSGKENSYHITLKPKNDDIDLGICSDTEIIIEKNSYSATGGILEYFLKEIGSDIEAIAGILGNVNANPLQLRDQDYTNFQTYYRELLEKTKIDIPRRTAALTFLMEKSDKLPSEKQGQIKSLFEAAKGKWDTILTHFPLFFYRKSDKRLNSYYKYEDIERELKSPSSYPNSLLSDLLKAISCPHGDFLSAARTGAASTQNTIRSRIRRLVNDKINTPFAEFYQTEQIFLEIDFNNGTVYFTVRSEGGESMSLSERSNGLRWYLDTFIDASANDISGRNVVYLLDEPGTSLHVNAQQELIALFRHLADKGNQVVYTTHSPYMLDLEREGVHRIRAVVKDSDGYSRIYKTAYDTRIAPESQEDTLTPIIRAMGMNLQCTIGPALNKINIVTEGMSDYIFLNIMAKKLDFDLSKYAIIPAVGATNCVKICTILHGWGCKYIALFDYDTEGVESGGEYMRTELLCEMNRHFCYVKDVTQADIESKTYKTGYMIEDVVTHEEINAFCSSEHVAQNISKPLTAKLMCNAIELGRHTCSKNCLGNFQDLFNRIISYTQQ